MARLDKSALPWLWLSLLLVVLDAASKQWALAHLQLHQPVPIIPGLLSWTLVYNYGAAFSFLADHNGWQRWLFSALAIAISAMLSWWLARMPRHDWRQALPYALVIGGAIGNLIDRLMHGYVIDFIDAYWGEYHWPAFNLADAVIVAGAIGIALFGFVPRRRVPDQG
jgi:signal peptidase II